MWQIVDRRTERSTNMDGALQRLLRTHREQTDLELIVLARADGKMLAFDGPRIVCDELALYASLLASGRPLAIDKRRIEGLRVFPITIGSRNLVLATRGGDSASDTARAMVASLRGALRILHG